MKIKSLLLLAALFLSQVTLAQGPTKQWDYRFGTNDYDYLRSLQQTFDGGYIMGGYTIAGISGDKTHENQGKNDYWILKTNADGIKQWDARFGGEYDDIFSSMQQTSDSGYILGGYSASGISGDKTQASQGGWDYWIVKTDAHGVKQWDKRFGGDAEDFLEKVQQTSDGGYILGGTSNSGISGNKSQANWGGSDFWIVKTNAQGVKQWDAHYGGTDGEGVSDLMQTSDGGYILGGSISGDANGDISQADQGKGDYWIIKIDGSGVKQWDARFGGNKKDFLESLRQTSDGGYILGGYSNSDLSGDKSQAKRGWEDYWIVKTDANGVKQWDATFGGYGSDKFQSLVQTTDDGYLLGGYSDSGSGGDKSQEGQGSDDYWIVKTNGNGVQTWDARFGGSYAEELFELKQTSDGGYILGGWSSSQISGDKSQAPWSSSVSDYWILKTIPEILVTCDIPTGEYTNELTSSTVKVHWDAVSAANKYKVWYRVTGTIDWTKVSATNNFKKLTDLLPSTQYDWQVKSVCNDLGLGNSNWSATQNFTTLPARLSDEESVSLFDVYPNPFVTTTTISFSLQENTHASIELFDLTGRKIKTIVDENLEAGNHEVSMSREQLKAGIYFLKLRMYGRIFINKIVVE